VNYKKKEEIHTAGEIYQEAKRYYLACNDGCIELEIKFSARRNIKLIFKL
jgi:hypothetical protein